MMREITDASIAFFAKNPITKYERAPKIPSFTLAAIKRGRIPFKDPFFLPRARTLEVTDYTESDRTGVDEILTPTFDKLVNSLTDFWRSRLADGPCRFVNLLECRCEIDLKEGKF
ncbi:hypothetical protein PUN28_016593 [Cardiocondyla obscurior]|uniref:Uncharacterized protein n=1 Tax=Cardiocondyla obscurior TaxID=286306 RepID=A0AAW2ESR3_9HYME